MNFLQVAQEVIDGKMLKAAIAQRIVAIVLNPLNQLHLLKNILLLRKRKSWLVQKEHLTTRLERIVLWQVVEGPHGRMSMS